MFVWVGAAVDIPYKVYRLLGNLGAKLYFFRLPAMNKTEDLLFAQTKENHNNKIKKITETLFDYLKWFDIGPDMTIENSSNLLKMKWDDKRDDEQAIRYIIKLAKLLSHLRCVAITWHTEDSQGSEYAYSVSQPEDPSRATTVLLNLAKGHSLLSGRNYISKEDVSIVVKTVLSTAQIERVSLFDLLLANGGRLTTTRIVESLNISKPTALRTMAEFKAIGLVDKEHEGGGGNMQISLKDEFNWFLSDEFEKFRESFTPIDNREYINDNKKEIQGCKEKSPLTSTNFSLSSPNNDDDNNNKGSKEETFWRIYKELEQQQCSNSPLIMEIDKITVSGQELKNRLMSTNKFFTGDAFQIIEDMLKKGKLEKVAFDTYIRKESKRI
jgi:DNA-binding transcriptional regulator GbsR (MarR family)